MVELVLTFSPFLQSLEEQMNLIHQLTFATDKWQFMLSSGAISEQDVQLTAHYINPLSNDLWTQISMKKYNLQCSEIRCCIKNTYI